MVKNIRESEKALLRLLDDNSRMSFSKIGKKIKKSQQLVSYNVNALIKEGVIKRFYTIIDYSKMGVLSFRVYFKITYISDEKFNGLIEYLTSLDMTSWVATCGGSYDLICTFFAMNPSQFNKNFKHVIEKYPDQFRNYTILTTIVIRNYRREFSSAKTRTPNEVFLGGDREKEDIDEKDMQILSTISNDARVSSLEISSRVDLTPKSIIARLRSLEKREVILGYRTLLDTSKIDYYSVILLIKYHNVSVDSENKLIEYLRVVPNVNSVVKTLGEWDLEIEIEVKDNKDLRRIEFEIRQKFSSLIKEIMTVSLYDTFKKDFFPRILKT